MKTHRTLVLLVLTVLVPGGVHAQSGPPGSIAFHSNRTENATDAGNNKIYVMDANGSAQLRRTFDTNNNQRPDISPDGTKVAFASNRSGHFEIWLMNSDGSDPHQLTTTAPTTTGGATVTNTWPRWSPNGEWIAFQSNVIGNSTQIYVIRPNGLDLKPITLASSGVNQFPAWSPDGTRLTVRRNADIVVLDMTGGSPPTQLTFATGSAFNQMAAWSPDGTRIAFLSTRDGYPSIFLMKANGDEQTNLTPKVGTDNWVSRAPAWSPNGEYIYFTGVRSASGPNEQLYVMRADGSDVRALTGPPSISNGASLEASVRWVRPPTITSLTATPDVLWPANHKMTPVSLKVGVFDVSDSQPDCHITGVTSNEPSFDWRMTGSLTAELLADRSGGGSGRIYTLTVICTNSSALSSTATVNVSVPHDQRK